MANRILSAFLDGFTGGSLFVPLRRPGAPTQVFADPDAEEYPQKDLVLALLEQQALEDAQARAEADSQPQAAYGTE